METDAPTTIRVRESTRLRLYAQRRALEGADVESADEILTRLLDELDAFRCAVKGRGGGRSRSEASLST